jgi:hypothetical protein
MPRRVIDSAKQAAKAPGVARPVPLPSGQTAAELAKQREAHGDTGPASKPVAPSKP